MNKETAGVLFKGMRGRGKDMDIEMLQKPLTPGEGLVIGS